MDRPNRPSNSRPIKEAYFVRIAVDGERALFCDATAYVGKTLPYQKPQATCAMRVESEAVYFALLHLPRKSASDFVAKPVKVPRAPFAKMADAVRELEIGNEELVVDLDKGEELGIERYRFSLRRDENQVGRLEIMDGFGAGAEKNEDPTFDLPDRSVEMRLYMRSPRVGRVVAVNFVGHIGKPRTPETVGRAAAMALQSIAGLNEFRALAMLEAMRVPAPPTKWANRPSGGKRAEERVVFSMPLRMFTPTYEPVGACDLHVEIDLETSNQATGRLLYHLNPPEDLAETFAPYKRIVDEALNDALRRGLGEALEMVVIEVVLGEMSVGSIDMLRDAVAPILGLDVTPREFRFHDAPADASV